MINVHDMISKLIADWEGGYVNNPHDKGGPTKFGITQATLSVWFGRPASIDDVETLSIDTAIKIFEKNFYYAFHIDTFPECLQPVVFDMYVQHQPHAVGTILQQAFNSLSANFPPLALDGIVGPKTIMRGQALVEMYNAKPVVNAIVSFNLKYYQRLANTDPDDERFENDWQRRANSYKIA